MARFIRIAAVPTAAALGGLVLAFAPELTAILVALAYGSFVVALAWRVGGLVQPEPVAAQAMLDDAAAAPAAVVTSVPAPARAARAQH